MSEKHKIPRINLSLGPESDYQCVDDFLCDFMQVQAIKGGLETGVLERLSVRVESYSSLLSACDLDEQGLTFLLLTLEHHKIIQNSDNSVREANKNTVKTGLYKLSETFSKAFTFKDYLQAKIEFSNFLAPDLIHNIGCFLHSEERYMASSRLFELFDYQRALEITPENIQFTQRWVSLTTALTQYEAGVCLAHHNFSQYNRIMDIGGNSGEFAQQLVEKNPHVFATVVDLPVVCDIGRRHTCNSVARSHLEFYPANALQDPLPGQQCLISFKSVLHDWPEKACLRFLQQAYRALRKSGEVFIFERSAIDLTETPVTYGMLPTALFYRSYRLADDYIPLLKQCGFHDITIKYLPLETGFHIITASK